MDQESEKKAEYPRTGLPLPERNDQKSSIFHQPEAVTSWLKELPLASPLECAKSLFSSLFEMNRINMDSEHRIKTLESMLPNIESVASNLKSKYVTTSFPLSDKNRKIALLTRELYRELCTGYKAAIADQIETGSAKSQQNTHIIAVHRVMYYLSKVLFHSYIIYEAYPQHIWRELHVLFTYSSINKIDRVPVLNDADNAQVTTSVKKLYIKSLLLAAASPYQLRQREIDTLCLQLDKFCSLAKLTIRHIKDQENNIGFFINLHSDNPPVPIAYAPKQSNRQMFVLDTRRILQRIQQSLSAESSEDALEMSDHLTQMLLKNWGHAPHRHYVRTRLNFDLNIAIGLNEIHELLDISTIEADDNNLHLEKTDAVKKSRDNLQRSSLFTAEDEDEDITVLTLGNYHEGGDQKGNFLSSQQIEKDLRIEADELTEEETDRSREKTHECKTINESSGGYCIEWPKGEVPGIRVGQVIGIRSATQTVNFSLAISRWLKNIPDAELMVGIEIISHSTSANKVRLDEVVPKHKEVTYYPGLNIPASTENPASIIVPSDLFAEGQVLIVKNQQDIEQRVKLVRLVESTGLFSQYETAELPSTGTRNESQLKDEHPTAFG